MNVSKFHNADVSENETTICVLDSSWSGADADSSGADTDIDSSGWLALFVMAGITMGIAISPMWTVAYSQIEDQSTPEKGGLNCALMNGRFT